MKIDFTYLETVSDGDEEFIKQFVNTFEQTANSLTQKLLDQFESGDIDGLGKTAHQLKPSAKMLGLEAGDHLEEFQHNPEKATKDRLDFVSSNCLDGLSELKNWAKEKGVE